MRLLLSVLAIITLSACSLIYHVPVSQGNILNPEDVAQLETGMTEEQVEYLLGTPALKNQFREGHWSYMFYYRDQNKHIRQNALSLEFDQGKLSKIEGADQYIRASKKGNIVDTDEVKD